MIFSVSPCLRGKKDLQSRLNSIRQCPKIRHTLQFIVRQLDREVMFQPRQQIARLKAVDPERLEKIVVGRDLLPWHSKMPSPQPPTFFHFPAAISPSHHYD